MYDLYLMSVAMAKNVPLDEKHGDGGGRAKTGMRWMEWR